VVPPKRRGKEGSPWATQDRAEASTRLSRGGWGWLRRADAAQVFQKEGQKNPQEECENTRDHHIQLDLGFTLLFGGDGGIEYLYSGGISSFFQSGLLILGDQQGVKSFFDLEFPQSAPIRKSQLGHRYHSRVEPISRQHALALFPYLHK